LDASIGWKVGQGAEGLKWGHGLKGLFIMSVSSPVHLENLT